MKQLNDEETQEEVQLLNSIENEMQAIKSVEIIGAPIDVIFRVYGRINRVNSLCTFGKKHLKSLTLRGANKLRMIELELSETVTSIESTIEQSSQTEILQLWKAQAKA